MDNILHLDLMVNIKIKDVAFLGKMDNCISVLMEDDTKQQLWLHLSLKEAQKLKNWIEVAFLDKDIIRGEK